MMDKELQDSIRSMQKADAIAKTGTTLAVGGCVMFLIPVFFIIFIIGLIGLFAS